MKRTLKPTTLLAPLPVVLVSSFGTIERGGETVEGHNVMTAAWTGIVNSTPPMLSVSIRKERATHSLISASGQFAVSVASADMAEAVDFCGVKSGRELDKFAALNLTPLALPAIGPVCGVAECPVVLACEVERVISLPSHDVFVAEIVDVRADEALFDGEALRLGRMRPLAYFHGNYYEAGDELGFFGFSVASDEVRRRRLPRRKAPGRGGKTTEAGRGARRPRARRKKR